jgi:hypothetical protein
MKLHIKTPGFKIPRLKKWRIKIDSYKTYDGRSIDFDFKTPFSYDTYYIHFIQIHKEKPDDNGEWYNYFTLFSLSDDKEFSHSFDKGSVVLFNITADVSYDVGGYEYCVDLTIFNKTFCIYRKKLKNYKYTYKFD